MRSIADELAHVPLVFLAAILVGCQIEEVEVVEEEVHPTVPVCVHSKPQKPPSRDPQELRQMLGASINEVRRRFVTWLPPEALVGMDVRPDYSGEAFMKGSDGTQYLMQFDNGVLTRVGPAHETALPRERMSSGRIRSHA